jgi:AcrR family transcriptional regulator
MARAVFQHADFIDAALALAAERGPAAVTVGAITARLRAPTGSFYHRFVSRNALLGALWLRTVLNFQAGVIEALDTGDGLKAALHTPLWAREHLDEARLLLLYDRDDFVQGEWPTELSERVAEMTKRMDAGAARRARVIFGHDGPEEIQLAQFLVASLPVAAVRQYLVRREPPPPVVDRLIRVTYAAIVADYQARAKKRRKKTAVRSVQ